MTTGDRPVGFVIRAIVLASAFAFDSFHTNTSASPDSDVLVLVMAEKKTYRKVSP